MEIVAGYSVQTRSPKTFENSPWSDACVFGSRPMQCVTQTLPEVVTEFAKIPWPAEGLCIHLRGKTVLQDDTKLRKPRPGSTRDFPFDPAKPAG